MLADENIPAATIAYLRTQGLDVLSVREVSPGMADEAVLALAAAESRVLLTFDRDYGKLIFRHGKRPPRSVIYFRIYPATVDELNAINPQSAPWERRLLGRAHGRCESGRDQKALVPAFGCGLMLVKQV